MITLFSSRKGMIPNIPRGSLVHSGVFDVFLPMRVIAKERSRYTKINFKTEPVLYGVSLSRFNFQKSFLNLTFVSNRNSRKTIQVSSLSMLFMSNEIKTLF